MDTLSYVFTNTLRGYIGGASSIIPGVILYVRPTNILKCSFAAARLTL